MGPQEKIISVMVQLYDGLSKGDLDAVDNIFSHTENLLVIGTDPHEWWHGYDSFIRAHQAQFKQMGGSYFIEHGELIVNVEGAIGWVGDKVTFHFKDGRSVPARVTCIFHLENGDWKIVQHHISIGVSNRSVTGKELTL